VISDDRLPEPTAPGVFREIDAAAFTALRTMLPADAFVRLLAASVADIARVCADLETAMASGDAERVRRAAHRLSGVLGQYACPAAAEEANRVSTQPDASALAMGPPLVARGLICMSELRTRSQAL
jgi:HPt (histidine-containing phosphotransfer) domain-containing protein